MKTTRDLDLDSIRLSVGESERESKETLLDIKKISDGSRVKVHDSDKLDGYHRDTLYLGCKEWMDSTQTLHKRIEIPKGIQYVYYPVYIPMSRGGVTNRLWISRDLHTTSATMLDSTHGTTKAGTLMLQYEGYDLTWNGSPGGIRTVYNGQNYMISCLQAKAVFLNKSYLSGIVVWLRGGPDSETVYNIYSEYPLSLHLDPVNSPGQTDEIQVYGSETDWFKENILTKDWAEDFRPLTTSFTDNYNHGTLNVSAGVNTEPVYLGYSTETQRLLSKEGSNYYQIETQAGTDRIKIKNQSDNEVKVENSYFSERASNLYLSDKSDLLYPIYYEENGNKFIKFRNQSNAERVVHQSYISSLVTQSYPDYYFTTAIAPSVSFGSKLVEGNPAKPGLCSLVLGGNKGGVIDSEGAQYYKDLSYEKLKKLKSGLYWTSGNHFEGGGEDGDSAITTNPGYLGGWYTLIKGGNTSNDLAVLAMPVSGGSLRFTHASQPGEVNDWIKVNHEKNTKDLVYADRLTYDKISKSGFRTFYNPVYDSDLDPEGNFKMKVTVGNSYPGGWYELNINSTSHLVSTGNIILIEGEALGFCYSPYLVLANKRLSGEIVCRVLSNPQVKSSIPSRVEIPLIVNDGGINLEPFIPILGIGAKLVMTVEFKKELTDTATYGVIVSGDLYYGNLLPSFVYHPQVEGIRLNYVSITQKIIPTTLIGIDNTVKGYITKVGKAWIEF